MSGFLIFIGLVAIVVWVVKLVGAKKTGKPISKTVKYAGIAGIVVLCLGAVTSSSSDKDSTQKADNAPSSSKKLTKAERESSEKKASELAKKDDSEISASESSTSSSVASSSSTASSTSVPADYKSALTKAKSYSSMMHMSKAGIYDQLTSEYGEKFSAEAAQYAVDNLQADYNKNALAKAKSYRDDMSMSPEAIRDQLTSEYGEKFTAEEADYAIQHLND